MSEPGALPSTLTLDDGKLPVVLTIAGSDSSGGAGIQADLKTIEALGLYGASAITAVTAQNTMGVSVVYAIPAEVIEAQVDAVFDDMSPVAVKIGMVGSAEAVHAIARALRRHGAGEPLGCAVVLDPVMVASSGASLTGSPAIEALVGELFPLATLLTPNIPEAEALSGIRILGELDERAAMACAADALAALVPQGAVLVKGGHAHGAPADLLRSAEGSSLWLEAPRVEASNSHGTGCTLSSAAACGLARGLSLEDAVREAKSYLTGALRAGLDLGRGSGPLDHMWALRG